MDQKQILDDYNKKILIHTIKTGSPPVRRFLFTNLFLLTDVKTIHGSHFRKLGFKQKKYPRYNSRGSYSGYSNFLNYSFSTDIFFKILKELESKRFTKYIGDYNILTHSRYYRIDIVFNDKNVRWDLIDHDLREKFPDLVKQNHNTLNIIKASKVEIK
jgi:hypothetical protein